MTPPQDPIRGKVARILNSRELVINVGSNVGVTVGMLFDVLDPKGESIPDPDTGEILGSIPRPKVRVKVTHVQDALSVASTFRVKKVHGTGAIPAASLSAWLMGIGDDRVETLKTNEKTWEDIDEKQSYVKTGDPVIQVEEATTTGTTTVTLKPIHKIPTTRTR